MERTPIAAPHGPTGLKCTRRTPVRGFLFCLLLLLLPPVRATADGRYADYLASVGPTAFILISKQDMTLTFVDEQGNPVKEYGIACAVNYGNKERRGDHKTPEGIFKIKQIVNSRGWAHDFGDGKGLIHGAYGPWFLRLDVPGFNDIGIHGTHLPESIGTRASEGCIRLRNEDIEDLKSRVQLGTPVIILPDPQPVDCPAPPPGFRRKRS